LDHERKISDSFNSGALDDTMLGNRFQGDPRRTWINTNVSSPEVASDGLSPSEPSPNEDAASDAMSFSPSASSVSRLPGAADRVMNLYPLRSGAILEEVARRNSGASNVAAGKATPEVIRASPSFICAVCGGPGFIARHFEAKTFCCAQCLKQYGPADRRALQYSTSPRNDTRITRPTVVNEALNELTVPESTRGMTDATICDNCDGLGTGAGASKIKGSLRWCGLTFCRQACANLYRQELSIVKKAVDIATEQCTGGYNMDVVQAKLLVHTIAARRTARRAGFEGEGDLEVDMESTDDEVFDRLTEALVLAVTAALEEE